MEKRTKLKWIHRLLGDETQAERIPVDREASRFSGLATAPAPNLVDGINALSAYYRYLEAKAYEAELKTARDRRNFRDEFLKRIDTLLSYRTNVDARRQIQLEIEKEVATFGSSPSVHAFEDVDAEARLRDANGYALLALSKPLTWESLRTAYRDAAKKHHPDLGGDDSTMQKVNDAYALFTSILRRSNAHRAVADSEAFVVINSVDRLFSSVLLMRFTLLIDDLAGDDAYEAYKQLTLQDIEELAGVDLVARLCQLLAAAGRSADATIVLSDLQNLVERGAERQLNFRPIYIAASEAVKDPKHIRFIPNHPRQASNLLRLGIIDRARYEAVLKRINVAEDEVNESETAFVAYVRTHQFLRLPRDPLPDNIPVSGLVPAPGYYSRVETLSPVQLREYATAFHAGASELVGKYLIVRVDALMRAPFMGYNDTGAVLKELFFLASAPGLRGSQAPLCQLAITLLRFLDSLTPSEREERIYLLNSLDCTPGQMEITVTIATPGNLGRPRISRPIFLNPQFTKFATGPLERIERYVRTGSEDTAEEREVQQKRWQDARAFQDSEIYKRARDVTWAKQKDPEEVVAAVSALCEAMYERAAQGDNTMEIGYWTNDLTISLVKLKRYDEAREWIDRLSEAPSEIQQRTARSVADALARRRNRCLKAAASS